MIDFGAVTADRAALSENHSKRHLVLWIALGLIIFATIVYMGVNLSFGAPGCRLLGLSFFAPYCGGKVGIAFTIALFVTPIAAYFALKRPMIFPVAFYVLLVPSDSFLNLTSAGSITKLLAMLCAAVMVFWLLRKRTFASPGKATLMWVLLGIYVTASILWAYNPDKLVIQLYSTFMELILLYLIITAMPVDESDYKALLVAFVLGSIISTAFGYQTFHSGNASVVNDGRLKAHFGGGNILDSDQFSASLIFPIGLVLMAALRRRFSIAKIACIGAFCILMVGQYIVGARLGIVGDCAMIAYFIWKSRYRTQLMYVPVLAVLVSFMTPNAIWAKFFTPDPTGGSNRVQIWKVALAAFRHNWLFGVGQGNFDKIYSKYFLQVFQRYNAHYNRASHSILVSTAVELGIIGIVIMFGAWYATFNSLREIPKDDTMFDLRVALEGALVGSFIAALFVDVMYNKWMWFDFAIIAMTRTLWLRRKAQASIGEAVRLRSDGLSGPHIDGRVPLKQLSKV